MVKDKVAVDTVNVSATKSDNSVVIGGLEYGYYLVDEVSDVEGTHSAASLCIVNTANPTADVNIKSDYPSVIKKFRKMITRTQLETMDGMILQIMKLDKQYLISMNLICQTPMDMTPIIMHGMM